MSRLDFWFRLFHHAALGLASVCLLYSEAFFLPAPLLLCLYLLAALQVLAFGADGRRWVLPGWGANLLAGAVAGGGAAWIVLELNSPDSVLADLPLPAGLLPYIGPILIGLLVVKLFRPRTPRDFWLLQGVGALQVALACVLATNPETGLLFAALLAAYVGFALGCLALRHFQEEQSARKTPADRLPFAGRMAPFCLLWTLAAAAVAAPLFLLTPRLEGTNWDSRSLAVAGLHADSGDRTGFSQTIDLNRSGTVQVHGEEVFRVAVVAPPGEAVPDLPPGQRWRGGVLDTYKDGRWSNEEAKQMDLGRRRAPPLAPPLGPGLYRLDFTVSPRSEGFFLAEPVRPSGAPDRPTRVDLVEKDDRLKPELVSGRVAVLQLLIPDGRHEYRYRQTAYVGDDVDRTPSDNNTLYTDALKVQNVPGLAYWTTALLKRLTDDPAYGLSAADVTPVAPGSPKLPQKSLARVGRALTAYLAHSGDYGYTLDLRRQDANLDPVMDFLVNVKAGHCERYASALALMLRSQGISSRVVVGFRGAEERSAEGAYVVRQNQAHAWVEMSAPLRREWLKSADWEWVTLDPTPATEPPAPAAYTLWDWWQDGERAGQAWWGGMVVNYGTEQQADLWASLQSPQVLSTLAAVGLSVPALVVVGGLTYVGFRRRRRARGTGPKFAAPAAAGYARLLALLARHGGPRPASGQTPREFAAGARRFLSSLPSAATFADVPGDLVDRLYRVRFGGRAPAVGEDAAAEARLDALATALRAGERGA